MIWANVTKFGQNFIAPRNFLAGTPMQQLMILHSSIAQYVCLFRMSFDLVYVNVRYSPQHNSKVGRKSFDNF